MALDRAQAKRRRAAPQFIAMAADFLPESLALIELLAGCSPPTPRRSFGAVLLALLIGLQNLPEGFNAWHELSGHIRPRVALRRMLLLALLGPVCGTVGWFWLADQDAVLGSIMLVAAGGILYLTFQDIAPQSRLERHWTPPLGAVLGFALALVSELAFP